MTDTFRVLLVEDELHDARQIKRMFGECPSAQFEVEHCVRLREATARLASASFDIVLLDLSLPDSCGLETFDAVQQQAPGVPIVILSGFEDESLALAAVKRGAQDYLVKLLDSDDAMVRAVHYAIERHRAGQALREREEHLRLLSEQLPCMFWTTDTHLHVTSVYGTAVDLEPKHADNPSLLPTDLFDVDAPSVLLSAHEEARAGSSRTLEVHSHDRIYQIELQPFRRDGHVTGTIGMALDITEQRHLDVELRVTRKIQEGLRPRSAPELPGFDIAGRSRSASAAGGDYFDYFPINGDATGVVLCDVGGHGLGPAMMMCQTRAYLRALALNYDDPGEMLSLTNAFLSTATNEQRLVALFFAKINHKARSICYANAGQLGYVIDASGRPRLLGPTSIPLNVRAGEKIPTAEPVVLTPGEMMILFTDGITETASREGEQFGIDRMIRLLHEQRKCSAAESVDALFKATREFACGGRQEDDMTAVLIKAR